MKRNHSDAEDEEDPKRSKLQLNFYASGEQRAVFVDQAWFPTCIVFIPVSTL
jgi:hypothetical protein